MNAQAIFDAYVRCALWSEMDQSEPNGGYPLEDNYSAEDITDAAKTVMRLELNRFLTAMPAGAGTLPDEQIGLDFWLTRNWHGTGFWDRDLGELGMMLTDLSHTYGECSLYVGDDRRLHFYNG